MGISVQQRGRRFQLRVTHKLLPRAFFWTFDDADSANEYGSRMMAVLDVGMVPPELQAAAPGRADSKVADIMSRYLDECPALTASDNLLIRSLLPAIDIRMSDLTYAWVESYVTRLKRELHLAPGTIRKHVGALARVIDWHLRRIDSTSANPLRMLPRGYSSYTDADAVVVEPKTDVVRDRRLLPSEETAIRAVLNHDMESLFDVLLWTGLRLREAYRLRVDQIDLARGVIRVEGSKGARGRLKPRVVPIPPELDQSLTKRLKDRVGLVWPFWSGTPDDLKSASDRLSSAFSYAFRKAGVQDLGVHDLRHEACCRWLERRSGGWIYSEVEVSRIMGWSSLRMIMRYASIRGEDLAAKLR